MGIFYQKSEKKKKTFVVFLQFLCVYSSSVSGNETSVAWIPYILESCVTKWKYFSYKDAFFFILIPVGLPFILPNMSIQ